MIIGRKKYPDGKYAVFALFEGQDVPEDAKLCDSREEADAYEEALENEQEKQNNEQS